MAYLSECCDAALQNSIEDPICAACGEHCEWYDTEITNWFDPLVEYDTDDEAKIKAREKQTLFFSQGA